MYRRTRRLTHRLFAPNRGGRAGYFVDWGIMLLIIASVTAVILQTVDALDARFSTFFWWFEVFATLVFTIEYVGRMWAAVEDDQFQGPITGRLNFARQPLVIIDLLAILPFYLALVGAGANLQYLRALRLFRIVRLLKMARYSKSLQGFAGVFRQKSEELMIAFGANVMVLVLASSTMYYLEHPEQPEAFSSIPATFWWGVVTITTVGYGDVTPVTPLGKVAAGFFALVGIAFFALPAAILASGFMEVLGEDEDEETYSYCPHCGEDLDVSLEYEEHSPDDHTVDDRSTVGDEVTATDD